MENPGERGTDSIQRCSMAQTPVRRYRARNFVRIMSASCWLSFLTFLCVSESFRKFCHEVARLAAKL